MKRERLIILLGVLVALVFFYLGLNEWLKTKEEQAQPLPIVVKPSPQKQQEAQPQAPSPAPAKETPPSLEKKPEVKEAPKSKEKDLIAQKIKEEKKTEKPEIKEKKEAEKPQEAKKVEKAKKAPLKTYTVQIGAFKSKDGADKVAERARRMGYRVNIVEEDNFYKVRISLGTENIKDELKKLRAAFGGAILKQ